MLLIFKSYVIEMLSFLCFIPLIKGQQDIIEDILQSLIYNYDLYYSHLKIRDTN